MTSPASLPEPSGSLCPSPTAALGAALAEPKPKARSSRCGVVWLFWVQDLPLGFFGASERSVLKQKGNGYFCSWRSCVSSPSGHSFWGDGKHGLVDTALMEHKVDDVFGSQLCARGFDLLNLYHLLRGISVRASLCIPGGMCWRTRVFGDRWAPHMGTQTCPLKVKVAQSFP